MNRRGAPGLLTPVLSGLVLAAFALTGLMTGVLTHGLIASLSDVPTATPSAVVATATTRPSSTVTRVPTSAPSQSFSLAATASPRTARAGGTLSVVAVATDDRTRAPVPGLVCALGAPGGNPPPLLADWPAPQTTDARGQASWMIAVPHGLKGTYGIKVSATGAHGITYYVVVWVAVKS
jgi:hypothetical protein